MSDAAAPTEPPASPQRSGGLAQDPPPRHGRCGPARPDSGGSAGRDTFIDAILDGNPAVVTILAIFVALVLGGLLIAFSDPRCCTRGATFFSDPGDAIAQAWDVGLDGATRRCSRARSSTRTRSRPRSTAARSARSSTRCRRPRPTPPR